MRFRGLQARADTRGIFQQLTLRADPKGPAQRPLGTFAAIQFHYSTTAHPCRVLGTQEPFTCQSDGSSLVLEQYFGVPHVDAVMRGMQGTSKKAAIVGFGPLPMRVGVAECRGESR